MADAGGPPASFSNQAPPPPPPPAWPPSASPTPPAPPATYAPPPPADAAKRPGRSRRFLVGGLIAVVLLAAAAGGLIGFRVFGGSADSLVGMAPGDTVVYVNVHLDPSTGQKLAINSLLDKFPALSGSSRDNTINGWIDSALHGTGLTHSDVRSWLGSDISFVVPSSALASSSSSSSFDAAVLVSSTNDSAAQASVDKLRQTTTGGGSEQWSTSTYNGVTLDTASGDSFQGVLAVTNHSLVIASTAGVAHEVIDTAQGRQPSLQSSGTYTKSIGEVASDRVVLVYADMGAIGQQLAKSLGSLGALGGAQSSLDTLKAYGGAAVAVAAQNDGLGIQGVADFDPSKLTPEERAQATAPPHDNGSLAYMPKSAYAAVALTGLKQTLQSLSDNLGVLGDMLGPVLGQLGLSGPNSIVNHLSGDGGLALSPSADPSTPGGAIVVGTDSQSAAEQFVSNLIATVCSGSCDPSQVTRQDDGGVVISSLPAIDAGLAPSWAVDRGWIIVGSSAAQVKAAIDGRRSGATLASSPDFQAVMNRVGSSNNGLAYVDIQSVLGVVRASLSPSDQSGFDSAVANLKPLRAFGLTTRNASDHVSINMFTLIR